MDVITADVIGSRLWTINFYREQLKHFAKVGLGNKTQHDVKVTKELIAITKKRLAQLTVIYDSSLTADGLRHRKHRVKRSLNGQQNHTNGNGATASSRMQDNGNPRHARNKS